MSNGHQQTEGHLLDDKCWLEENQVLYSLNKHTRVFWEHPMRSPILWDLGCGTHLCVEASMILCSLLTWPTIQKSPAQWLKAWAQSLFRFKFQQHGPAAHPFLALGFWSVKWNSFHTCLFGSLWRVHEMMHIKDLGQGLAYSKCSINKS